MSEITRHSVADRCLHWCNAILWLGLFFTGTAMLRTPELAPFGEGYPIFMRRLFGGPEGLFYAHVGMGILWITAFALYILTRHRAALEFLKELFSVRPGDMRWLARKPALMLLGEKFAGRTGLPTELPAQGFYNMGQKAFGMLSVTGCLVLAGTGLGMLAGAGPEWAGWFAAVHYAACGLVLTGLFIHLYMTLAVAEERPGLKSMFTGSVSEDYARHHHGAWLRQIGK